MLTNKLKKHLLKSLGILTEIDDHLKKFPRFAFVGEFGYEYFGYLPYLNFLATNKNLAIRTLGTKGSTPFYYFSKDHTEIPMESTGSWGTFKGALKLAKFASRKDPVFVPVNFTSRNLNLAQDLPKWESRNLHIYHEEYIAYRELHLPIFSLDKIDLTLPTKNKYFVINIKNYQSWDYQYIPNWYDKEDLEKIGQLARKLGYDLILNQSPVNPDVDDPIYDNQFVQDFKSEFQAIDLTQDYGKLSTSDATKYQIEILRNAEHVWAVQGGNAFLAISLAKSCSILMRGGADWIDYHYFRKLYSGISEIIFEVGQSRLLK